MTLKPTHQYDDIIHLPHHQSTSRAGMTMHDRAAQFSPFSALTGYEDVIEETGRLTQPAIELTEGSIEMLNEKLRFLAENIHQTPEVTVTYFEPDQKKNGGCYRTVRGYVKRVDAYEQLLRLTDGREIPMVSICKITVEK